MIINKFGTESTSFLFTEVYSVSVQFFGPVGLTLFHYSQICDLRALWAGLYLMERYFLYKIVLTSTDIYFKYSDITLD